MTVKADFDDVIQGLSSGEIVDCMLEVRKVVVGPGKSGKIHRTLTPKGEIPLVPGKMRDHYEDELKEQWGGGEFRLYPKDMDGEPVGTKIMIIKVPLSQEEERMARLDQKAEASIKEREAAEAEEGALKARAATDETARKIQEKNQPEEKKGAGVSEILAVVEAVKGDGGTDLVTMMQMQKSDDALRREREEEREEKRRVREEDREEKRRVREEDRKHEDEKTRKEEKAEAERIRKDERERWEKEVALREKEIKIEAETKEKAFQLQAEEMRATLKRLEEDAREERANRRKAEDEASKTHMGLMAALLTRDTEHSRAMSEVQAENLKQSSLFAKSQMEMAGKQVDAMLQVSEIIQDYSGLDREKESGGVLNEVAKGAIDVFKQVAARPAMPAPTRQPVTQPQPGQIGPPKPQVPQSQGSEPGVSLDGPSAATSMIQRLGQFSPNWIQSVLVYMRDKNFDSARVFAGNLLDTEYGPMAALALGTAEWPEIHDALASTIAPGATNARAVLEMPSAKEWWSKFKDAMAEFSEEEAEEEPAFKDEPFDETHGPAPVEGPEEETEPEKEQEESVEKSDT